MSLEYYKSSVPIQTSASQGYKDDLQSIINDQFDNASDPYAIQEELTIGGLDWQDVFVRLTHIINANTGQKLGDDWRQIIFQDMTHVYGLGRRYQFDDNIWITTNTDTYKYPTASTIVRRCDNTLKWYLNGTLIKEPCYQEVISRIKELDANTNLDIPQADLTMISQCNDNTKNININDRFLFGHQAFKVREIKNYKNTKTYDDNSVPLITFYFFKTDTSPNDDIPNNIVNGLTHGEQPTGFTGIKLDPVAVNNKISLSVGDSSTYSVYKYITDVKQSDTFTITATGLSNAYYTLDVLDGNTFKITCLQGSDTPVTITCKDNTTNETYILNVTLSGW